MLPDGAVKLTLYRAGGGLLLGRGRQACSTCIATAAATDLTARVSYVSPDPEFTPPVIYSLETRQKLVYLVEARPEGDATPLQPGQIVDVELSE